jgi:HEAT repeat protein
LREPLPIEVAENLHMTWSVPHWRDIVSLLEKRLESTAFLQEMKALAEQGYADEEAIELLAGLLGHYLLETAGLAAALNSPASQAVQELDEWCARTALLRFSQPEGLDWREHSLYRSFLKSIFPLIADLSMAMSAVLTAYVLEKDSLVDNPNALLAEADRLASRELERAKDLVSRAGALALRGKACWWGWPREIADALRAWTTLVAGLVNSLTDNGRVVFAPPEAQRAVWQKEGASLGRTLRTLSADGFCLAEIQLAQQSEALPSQAEELVYRVLDDPEITSDASFFAFQRYRDVLIPYLVGMARDVELWTAESTGEGLAPIRALKLLGRLRAGSAAEPLLQALVLTEPGDLLREHILATLTEIGQPALPPLLEALSYSHDRPFKLSLASVLGQVGRGSDLAYQALLALVDSTCDQPDSALALFGLAELRDPRAVPVLQKALAQNRLHPVDRDELEAMLDDLMGHTG